ncbi:hypothetical protein [Streptomyces sp. SudanB91_2054]|uniref:hypothetical protein n=1 Tax=Streptomyces sp. SudanB91_2054 TaxID=3035278 RepID=UPI0036DF3023
MTVPDYAAIRQDAETETRNELGAIARPDDRIERAAHIIRQADAEIALYAEDRNRAIASLYFHDLYEGAYLGQLAGVGPKNAVREILSKAIHGDAKKPPPPRMTDAELQAFAKRMNLPHLPEKPHLEPGETEDREAARARQETTLGHALRAAGEIIEAAKARRKVAVVFMRDAALALSEEPYGWDGPKIAEHAGVGKKLIWQQQATARAARERARKQR